MNKRIYIYVIYFPSSNKPSPYYVGQTAYLEKRMFVHLNSKYLVGNALRKYDDWQVKVLHTCKTREANRIEIEEIRNYNCVAPNGYNLTRGGEGIDGYQWTEEQRKNQSERLQGTRTGENGYFYGKHHTKEWCENKSKEVKGTKNPAVSESNKRRKGIKNPAVSESNKKRRRKKLSEESKEKMRTAQNRPEIKYKILKTKLVNLQKRLEQDL